MSKPYTLYYWPIPFRGHFIRYALAYAGQDWDEPGMDALVALKAQSVEDQPFPFMAPPVLHDHAEGLWLPQMPAILDYLGRKHGLMPGDAGRDALVQVIIGNAGDVLEELTCNCGASMWTQATWDAFLSGRLARWMEIFEAIGQRHGLRPGSGYLLGTDAPGLADLVTAALWHTMGDRLPPLRVLLRMNAPAIAGLSDRIAALPAIAAMRTEQDARMSGLYCGGEIEASLRSVLGLS